MWVDESAAQRRTRAPDQHADLPEGTAAWHRLFAGAAEAARAFTASLIHIVARATHGLNPGNNQRQARHSPGDGIAGDDETRAHDPRSDREMGATESAWQAADPLPNVDARPVEPTISRVAGRDRRLHEMLGEPLGQLDRAPTAPLELAGLLETGLSVQQINFLVFQRWAIGGPRFPHTIRLSWEGERRGLLYKLARW